MKKCRWANEITRRGKAKWQRAIGFRPLPDDLIQQISRKYQLYR